MPGHSFSPISSPTPSSSSQSFHSLLSHLAFPLHPEPVPGRSSVQPLWSLWVKHSLHHTRRELATLDQTTHRWGHDLPKVSSISRMVAKPSRSHGWYPLPCCGVDGDSELTLWQEAQLYEYKLCDLQTHSKHRAPQLNCLLCQKGKKKLIWIKLIGTELN